MADQGVGKSETWRDPRMEASTSGVTLDRTQNPKGEREAQSFWHPITISWIFVRSYQALHPDMYVQLKSVNVFLRCCQGKEGIEIKLAYMHTAGVKHV